MSDLDIQPGSLVYLRGASQYRRLRGENASAGICIAVDEIGVEVHSSVEQLEGVEYLNEANGEDRYVDFDNTILASAGLIIKTSPDDNSAVIKDLLASSPRHHRRVPIHALTTTGWFLAFLEGLAHWIPGSFVRGENASRYYFGPDGEETKFQITGQGFRLSDETIEQLRLLGVEIKGQSYFSQLRTRDLLKDCLDGR